MRSTFSHHIRENFVFFHDLTGTAQKNIKERKNHMKKALAITLILFILLSIFPISAFASKENSSDYTSNTARRPDAITVNENYVSNTVQEIVSRREENVKHFLLPDGSVEAIIYSNPVHRKDESGKWQDIDNRLGENSSKTDQGYITSDERTIFAKKISADSPKIFEIHENGYEIKVLFNSKSLKCTNAKLSNHAKKYTPYSDDTFEEQYKRLREIDNTTSILYKNILNGIDFEYKIYANDIKENIIINKRSSEYKYSFVYHLSGLCANLNSDGSISLTDITTGESKYNMSAPFMYDANGDISNSVYYTLEKLGDSIYEINVVANAQWINSKERTLPITIDPLVESSKVVWDTYVSTSSKDSNFGTDTTVLVGSQYTAFFKSNMPTLPNGATIQSATWYGALYYMDGVNLKTIIEARAMEGSWNEYNDTYNTLYANYGADLGISSTVLDTKTIISNNAYTSDNPCWISFDVTDAVQSWYNGTSNYGIAICHNHTYLYGGSNYYTVFVSWDAKTTYTSYYKIKYSESRIPDGVYRLKNYNGLYLTVDGDGVESGSNLIQATDSTAGGSSEATYNQLFKISYLGTYGLDGSNYYSVRPMTNCGLGIYASTSAVSNPTVTTMTNPNASHYQTWIISVSGNYYTIRNGYASNFGYYLTTPSNTTNNASITTTKFELNASPSNTSKWTLDRYICDIEEVGMISIPPTIKRGETIDYEGYMRSSQIDANGPVIYLVANDDFTETDKASINSSTGVMTALKAGNIKVGLTYNDSPYSWWWNVEIGPSFVDNLLDHPSQLVSISDISYTDDGFYMLTTPLSSILNKAGIYELYDRNQSKPWNILQYYDDWYLFAVDSNNKYEYGLLKMREEEASRDAGVSISFVGFDYSKILNCIDSDNAYENSCDLTSALDIVTNPGTCPYNEIITEYFSKTESKASYLIAEEYIQFIVKSECINNLIKVPDEYVTIYNLYVSTHMMIGGRIPKAIEANNEKAGRDIIYGLDTDGNGRKDVFYINIRDPNNLTIYEKYAILMTHTGNVTFNSFAAEVEYHADALFSILSVFDEYYSRAIRADMGLSEEIESGVTDQYYDLNSNIVQAQINAHGEY